MTLATLSEKTGLSVGLVVVLAGMLVAGVGTFVATQSDVAYLRGEVAALKEADRLIAQEQALQAKQVIEYRSDTRYIIQTLGEMKSQLDRLTVSGIRPARANQ